MQALWPEKPARARQKDVDARWTVKVSKAKPAPDGTERPDIAIPTFGYEASLSIDLSTAEQEGASVAA